ncbi:DUF6074 family protein [Mesorhizobium temperatum]|uniref:Uncharacterized protein n=1 Tax=Mesorhizobium temperatum TaxID=241416 RepID=A0A271LN23_9HYPH|nr:DUF6074 family protein [Mesorhizobium temperatum]PAQ09541.1 hypothetical protein CIT26_13540 [Mesorhizobium temperatum]
MACERRPLAPWQRAKCQIVPFPAKKRVGKIRRTAEVLGGRHGKGADHYWQQVITGMRSQMKKSGLPAAVIESELKGFADAVFAMMSIARPNDGDAA